jgi:hypothetical protein
MIKSIKIFDIYDAPNEINKGYFLQEKSAPNDYDYDLKNNIYSNKNKLNYEKLTELINLANNSTMICTGKAKYPLSDKTSPIEEDMIIFDNNNLNLDLPLDL